MKNLTLYEEVFQYVLLVLAIWHLYKRDWKKIKAVAAVLILSFVPAAMSALFQMHTDMFSRIIYLAVLLMSLYLGSTLKFYDKYKWWDRSVHFLSGVCFFGFGMAVAASHSGITKMGVLLFGFTFSVTLHVFWEVSEYLCDCIMHSNAQRWQKINASNNHISATAIQPAGLVDTMNDLICCLCGSVLTILIWWLIL